jgi:hypothetical protein
MRTYFLSADPVASNIHNSARGGESSRKRELRMNGMTSVGAGS